ARRDDEALAEYDRQANMQIDPPVVRMLRFLRALACEDADAAKQRLASYMETDDRLMPYAGEVLAHLADKPRLGQMLRSFAAEPTYRNTSHMCNLALLAGHAGDVELS